MNGAWHAAIRCKSRGYVERAIMNGPMRIRPVISAGCRECARDLLAPLRFGGGKGIGMWVGLLGRQRRA
ncbi:hypothetical protein NL676_002545 [Syzygium grande]|nr:hypothetical protein NL676_002545 [Syzygium grande]